MNFDHLKRASWWDTHPDKIPSDYGVPDRVANPTELTPEEVGAAELETAAEWNRLKEADIETDITY